LADGNDEAIAEMDGRIIRWQRESDRRERECYRWEAFPPRTDVGASTMKSCRNSGVLFPPLSLILAPRLLSPRIQRIASRVPKPRADSGSYLSGNRNHLADLSRKVYENGDDTATKQRDSGTGAAEPSALSGIIATTFSAAINLIIATVPRRRVCVMVFFCRSFRRFRPKRARNPDWRCMRRMRAYRSLSLSLSLYLSLSLSLSVRRAGLIASTLSLETRTRRRCFTKPPFAFRVR